ncbi:unnamed protein product [Brugia pahangi]|uniref:BHLH domain-containing protein n=1 Tax=Brugia pahangi TaxID=6280 RepID=A0A0N4T078_BRUPA|nr:unnamed protein product [Brugia pahangi]
MYSGVVLESNDDEEKEVELRGGHCISQSPLGQDDKRRDKGIYDDTLMCRAFLYPIRKIFIMSSLSSHPLTTETISTPSTLSPSTSLSSSLSSSSTDFSTHSQSSQGKFSNCYEVPLQNGRVNKVSCRRREHKRTIAKLRRMLPHGKNVIQCSELELINHIMDYIIFLEELLRSQENITDENHSSTIDVANLNRALSRFHLRSTNKRRPLRPRKQICA